MRWWDLVCVSTRGGSLFPSVLLHPPPLALRSSRALARCLAVAASPVGGQPLGHLSIENQQLAVATGPNRGDCDTSPNVPRSLYAFFKYTVAPQMHEGAALHSAVKGRVRERHHLELWA